MVDYFKTNIDQLHQQLVAGEITSEQLVTETLKGMDAIDPEVAAFWHAMIMRLTTQRRLTKPVSRLINR